MLRRSPRLTPAALAARRANALKSTGPRTEAGKARVALKPLRHGRYAVDLPDRLTRAGYVRGEAGLRWLLEPHPILTFLRQEAENAGGNLGSFGGLV